MKPYQTSKLSLNICRSFSLGVTIYSPAFNGCCLELNIACLSFRFWNRGDVMFGFGNYWNG
jgi:hypothetical protein